MTTRNLNSLFKPDTIALICGGGDIDMSIAHNLMTGGFKGPILPVDSQRWALEGALVYRDVASLPLVPSLAIITRPLPEVPSLIQALGERGTRAALLISNARNTPKEARADLFKAIRDAASPYALRILGPSSLGLNVPGSNIHIGLSGQRLSPGPIALITESGTIAQVALDIAPNGTFGFSHVIHLGDSLDVDLADILDYLAGDYQTRAILLYLERIPDARKFMSAARRAARIKPVIVLKPPRPTEEADDAVYDAAFRRAGLLRVDNSRELIQMVEVLKAAKHVHNDRLAILSNSSSMSLLAKHTLHCVGGRLAQLSEATQEGLESISEPSDAPNPVDVGDIASPAVYGQALDLLLADPGVDSILVIKTPDTVDETVAVADIIAQRMARHQRCIIASFPGARAGAAARHHLLERQVPTYGTTNDAVQAFMRIVQYKRNQALLMETPPSLPEAFTPNVAAARAVLAEVIADGRRFLIEPETMRLLAAYHIPTAELLIAHSPDEAAEIAATFNQPVAIKLITPDDLAQSHVGGVVRHLHTRDAVRETALMMLKRFECITPAIPFRGFLIQPMIPRDGAYDITIGAKSGEDFGPVLYFGQGGAESEVIDDLAYGLPPLNMHLAREIMAQTRLYQRLRYSLLRRANLSALALSLVKVSQMVIDLPELVELSINPLRVNARGVMVLNAKIQVELTPVVTYASVKRLAIRPYPKHLEETIHLSNSQALFLRPVLPEDEPALQALALRVSPEDLRLRFFQPIRELSHDLAATLTQIDYHRDMALVAVGPGLPGKAEIYGIVNLSADPDHERAEYSILIDQALKGVGLGNLLMRRIIAYARTCGISEIHGEVLQENKGMLRLDRTLGFSIHADPDDPGIKHVVLKLHATEVSVG